MTAAQDFAALNSAWQRYCAAENAPAGDALASDDAAYQGAPLAVLLLASLCAVEKGAPLAGDIINDLISSCAAMLDRMIERSAAEVIAERSEVHEVVTRLDILRELRRRERGDDIDPEQTNPGGAP